MRETKQYLLFIFLILSLAVATTGKAQVSLSFASDTCLLKLVEEALDKNFDVQIAELNMRQAETLLKNTQLRYLPSFAFSPSTSLRKSKSIPTEKSYSLPLTMDWELNLGGRQKYEKQIAKANYEETKYLLDYTKVQLIASVANAYFTLMMLDQQIVITKQCVENQESSLSTMRAFKEVGQSNDLAINEIESSCLNTKASLLELVSQQHNVESSLLLLLNKKNGQISRSKWENRSLFSTNTDSSFALQTLSNRPDVKAAEMSLASACGNVRVAKSAFYPSLHISAEYGWTNYIGEIVNPAQMLLKLIGSLTQPIFNRGVIKAQKEIAESQYRQAEINFEKALLTAGHEVENSLFEIKIMKEKMQIRKQQVEVSKLAFDNCQLLQNYSQSVTYIDVVMAHNTYLTAQIQETADWLLMQQAMINLYKASCPIP